MPNNKGQDRGGFPTLDIKAARALNPHTRTIQIQSILGGHSALSNFAAKDQYQASIGIDPSFPLNDSASDARSSGYLRPVPFHDYTTSDGAFLTSQVNWIKAQPKLSDTLFLYCSSGSAFTYITNTTTALSDGGSLSSSSGNGMAYYDNYMYFAKNTDIARYGPLNGSPAFDGTYWTSTLSKAALTNTSYSFGLLNHVMHRHSDGKLYIADIVGNQGTIHVISTTKTTVEGDTDNGSTANKLQFGYGLWPTAIESYGSQLVIGLAESMGTGTTVTPAKIAFWDTISQSFNTIIFDEFSDSIISGLKNVNGTLYIISSSTQGGFRVWQYIGGSSLREVLSVPSSFLPPQGAIDGNLDRLIFGAFSSVPENNLSVFSYGLQNPQLKKGVFNVLTAEAPSSNSTLAKVSAVCLNLPGNLGLESIVAATADSGSINVRSSYGSVSYGGASGVTSFWSQIFMIGQPFKITKIRVPLAQAVAANMIVTPKIYFDDGTSTTTLTAINNTNYPGLKNIPFRPTSATGNHNFWLEFRWTGSALCVLALPITIEYELIPD